MNFPPYITAMPCTDTYKMYEARTPLSFFPCQMLNYCLFLLLSNKWSIPYHELLSNSQEMQPHSHIYGKYSKYFWHSLLYNNLPLVACYFFLDLHNINSARFVNKRIPSKRKLCISNFHLFQFAKVQTPRCNIIKLDLSPLCLI